jgi:hypothetical protein
MQQDQLLLRTTLALRDHPQVKIVDELGNVLDRIQARTALFRACSEDFLFKGNAKRIKAIRAMRPDRPFIPCWRNQEAAVLPPSAEYWAGVR